MGVDVGWRSRFSPDSRHIHKWCIPNYKISNCNKAHAVRLELYWIDAGVESWLTQLHTSNDPANRAVKVELFSRLMQALSMLMTNSAWFDAQGDTYAMDFAGWPDLFCMCGMRREVNRRIQMKIVHREVWGETCEEEETQLPDCNQLGSMSWIWSLWSLAYTVLIEEDTEIK